MNEKNILPNEGSFRLSRPGKAAGRSDLPSGKSMSFLPKKQTDKKFSKWPDLPVACTRWKPRPQPAVASVSSTTNPRRFSRLSPSTSSSDSQTVHGYKVCSPGKTREKRKF